MMCRHFLSLLICRDESGIPESFPRPRFTVMWLPHYVPACPQLSLFWAENVDEFCHLMLCSAVDGDAKADLDLSFYISPF